MSGEKNLHELLRALQPKLNSGDYVFCRVDDLSMVDPKIPVLVFREQEAVTLILAKEQADSLQLPYSYVSSWITLTIHSSLEAIGFTAAISKALAAEEISCNIVAAFYHDHIFVKKTDAEKAMRVLNAVAG
jgi:hypothetical protein